MSKQQRKRVSKTTIAGKTELVTQDIDNPMFSRDHVEDEMGNYARIKASVNLRESSLVAMYHRGLIDKAQEKAGEKFRGLWECVNGKGSGAMDYSREPVDCSGGASTASDRPIDAGKELEVTKTLLGRRNFNLVGMVCGEGFQISELYQDKRARLSAMDALRGCLDDLAEHWLFKPRTTNVKRCA